MVRQIFREGLIILVLTTAFVVLAATVGVPRLRPRGGSAQAAVSFEESLRPSGLLRPAALPDGGSPPSTDGRKRAPGL